MTAPSDTPRTDAVTTHLNLSAGDLRHVARALLNHARALERQLSEARQKAIEEGAAMLEDGAKLLDDTESPISADAWRQAAGALRALLKEKP